jgi:transcription factor WhiB
MVPDDPRSGVMLAKKICAECTVSSYCLKRAEEIVERSGPAEAQGVWAGLTHTERGTMAVLGWPPRPCSTCGLDCVPINSETTVCNACAPKQNIRYIDYKPLIRQLAAEGLSSSEMSERLRLSVRTVTAACTKLRIKTATVGRRGKRPVQGCGTLAAKTRHARKGESWQNCACRHVPWKKGRRRTDTKESNN